MTISAVASSPVVSTATSANITLSLSETGTATLTVGAAVSVTDTSGAVTSALVSGSRLTAGGALSVTARFGTTTADGLLIQSTVTDVKVGVSVQAGAGGDTSVALGVDAAVSDSTAGDTTTAGISTGSDVCAGGRAADGSCAGFGGGLTVSATHFGGMSATIVVASVQIGVGKGGSVSLDAAVAVNTMSAIVDASIAGAGTTATGAAVAVTAAMDGSLTAVAVAASVGITVAAGSGGPGVTVDALGAGASNSTSGNEVTATIDGASVTAVGVNGVQVLASAGSVGRTVTTTAVAASVTVTVTEGSTGVQAGLGAAIAFVDLSSTVLAQVIAGAIVVTPGPITVQATSLGSVTTLAVAASVDVTISEGSSSLDVTLDVALADSRLRDDVEAHVLQSAMSGSAVTVSATSTTPVDAKAVAVTVKVSVGADTSLSLNGAGAIVLNDTTGGVAEARVNGSQLTATTGDLAVTAQSGLAPGSTATTFTATVVAVRCLDLGQRGAARPRTSRSAVRSPSTRRRPRPTRIVENGSNLCAGTRATNGDCTPVGSVTITAHRDRRRQGGVRRASRWPSTSGRAPRSASPPRSTSTPSPTPSRPP